MLTASDRFLWVFFQLQDLCEAASDKVIREILDNLPRGLDEIYARMLKRANNSPNALHVRRALSWVGCARRPLKITELQEAAAFSPVDKCWDGEKIPDADRLLQSCHGLLVRDKDATIRFAHHTLHQFLFSMPNQDEASLDMYRAEYWDTDKHELVPAKLSLEQAKVFLAEMSATYLSFSNFESTITTSETQRNITVNTVFKRGGPIAIPATLGLNNALHGLPYRMSGGRSAIKIPEIDFTKYGRVDAFRAKPPSELSVQYGMSA